MTKREVELLDEMLDGLEDSMSSAGCNDYEMTDDAENRSILEAAVVPNLPEDERSEWEPNSHRGKLLTFDFVLLGHLRRRLKEHFEKEVDA